MLLNHSAGLPGSTFDEGFVFAPSTTAHDTFLETLKTMRLQADPGAYSVYSNDCYVLAELVVEKVSGQDLQLSPLAVFRTVGHGPDADAGGKRRFQRDAESLFRKSAGNGRFRRICVSVIGTGGLFSTAEDLCRWGQAFMPGSPVLNADSLSAP